MSEKIYTFGGLEFRTQEHKLKILNIASPLQMYFKDEVKRLSKDLDSRKFERDIKAIQDLRNKNDNDKEYLESLSKENTKEIERVKSVIGKSEKTLKVMSDAFNNNEDYKKISDENTRIWNQAFKNLIANVDLVIPFIDSYLIGDVDKIDYTDWKVIEFISEIVADFFLRIKEKN